MDIYHLGRRVLIFAMSGVLFANHAQTRAPNAILCVFVHKCVRHEKSRIDMLPEGVRVGRVIKICE